MTKTAVPANSLSRNSSSAGFASSSAKVRCKSSRVRRRRRPIKNVGQLGPQSCFLPGRLLDEKWALIYECHLILVDFHSKAAAGADSPVEKRKAHFSGGGTGDGKD